MRSRDLRLLVQAAAVAVVVASCVSLRVESFNDPTLPSSAWSVYSNLELGYALTLPFFWSAFDLDKDIDKAVSTCDPGKGRPLQRDSLTNLHQRGVRLFICDARGIFSAVPVGYAARGALPTSALDAFIDDANAHQAPGRTVVEKRHAMVNAGDMIIQRVHERVAATNGPAVETTQYQFYVVRFNSLNFFFIEAPTASESIIDSDADLIGRSFTPLH